MLSWNSNSKKIPTFNHNLIAMSQLPLFYSIPTSQLPELQQHAKVEVVKKWFSKKYIHHYSGYLSSHATLLYGMGPEDLKGNPFLDLILWMAEEKDFEIANGRYDEVATAITNQTESSTLILTREHKEAFNSKIDIDSLSRQELKRIEKEYSGFDDDDETPDAYREALTILKNVLNTLQDDSKVIIWWFC